MVIPHLEFVAEPVPDATPLCVDLDGTLLRTDLLLESLFALLRQNALYVFLLPLWLAAGKAHFKQAIAQRVDLSVELLPFNEPFLAHLRRERRDGRRLVLATASNEKFAGQIARHLGIFDRVLASDAVANLSAHRKCEKLVETFGDRGFDYAGNAKADVPIWAHARHALVVSPQAGVLKKAESVANVSAVFDDRRPGLRLYLKAMRLHQWVKNLLVFVPVATAHELLNPDRLIDAALAFVCFGVCASSVYLLNDLLDLSEDRRHPTKRKRPLAAGAIPVAHAAWLIPSLLVTAFQVALSLPLQFLAVLALYWLGTLAYSLRLKRAPMVDVLVLAGLYTARVIGGAMAGSIAPSFWLLAFSMFLFLSLALVKRYSELLIAQKCAGSTTPGRGYEVQDMEALAQFGAASGYMAVLVLALYINSEQVRTMYSHPEAIWLLCPLLLYWTSRVWLLARREQMHEDPVVFAIEDRRSHLIAVLALLSIWLAV